VAKAPAAIRLGAADLGRQRHVCGLFEGPDDADGALVPFILDGLAQGDRVIYVVEDPVACLERLTKLTNVSPAVASGQLHLSAWSQTYLLNQHFSALRTLADVRRRLRESAWLGFTATRLIGDMQWARDGLPGVGELVDYERGLDAILARPRTVVICTYDVRRHAASRIEQVVNAHRAALVDGTLHETEQSTETATARERILDAAAVLFAEDGVARTGVDALIEAAEVAKATFYRHFPSKDDLIVAWLKRPQTRWFDSVRAKAESQARASDDVIPRFFEALAEWLETHDFIGCPFLNTAFEISDPAHPATRVIQEHLAEIGGYLEDRGAAAGHPDAARLGRQLHALVAGSISLAVANRTSVHALAARDAAMQLLSQRAR
jgi:AcrR family transcriptional regulator